MFPRQNPRLINQVGTNTTGHIKMCPGLGRAGGQAVKKMSQLTCNSAAKQLKKRNTVFMPRLPLAILPDQLLHLKIRVKINP